VGLSLCCGLAQRVQGFVGLAGLNRTVLPFWPGCALMKSTGASGFLAHGNAPCSALPQHPYLSLPYISNPHPTLPCSTTPTLPLAFLGATVSAGVAGGILFTAAHELLHGTTWLDRMAANVLLVAVGYPHWTESHLAHHVKVSSCWGSSVVGCSGP